MSFAETIAAEFRRSGKPSFEDIIAHEHEKEPVLARSLRFSNLLQANSGSRVPAFFGYRTATADFRPRDRPGVVVEFKRIGLHSKPGGPVRRNEYDVSTGLLQVLMQARGHRASEAVLLLLDGGEAANRPWDEDEQEFVRMLNRNKFGVSVAVVRLVVDFGSGSVRIEHYGGEIAK